MANHKQKGGDAGAAALGLAALAAAAAGAYYFYGSNAATQHRRKMKSWILKAQGDVMEKMENMKSVSKGTYEKAVVEVLDKYRKIKSIPPEELALMAKEMKSHWEKISAHMSGAPKHKASKKKTK